MEINKKALSKVIFDLENEKRRRLNLTEIECPKVLKENTLPVEKIVKFFSDINKVQKDHKLSITLDKGKLIVSGKSVGEEFEDIEQDSDGIFKINNVGKYFNRSDDEEGGSGGGDFGGGGFGGGDEPPA